MDRAATELENIAPDKVTLWQTVWSVLAAFYGVQSSKARQRDFTKGDPLTFILVGVVLTAAFIGVLLGIVKVILHGTGL
jgi:hypothetical protein